jgi:hypothetical protein
MTSSVMPSSGLLLSVTSVDTSGASGAAGAAVVAAALLLPVPLELAASPLPSDPQADASIARAARIGMNRFIMKTCFPSLGW